MSTETKTQSTMPTALNVHLANRKNGFDPMNIEIPGYDNDQKSESFKPQRTRDEVRLNERENDHSQTESMMTTLRKMLGY